MKKAVIALSTVALASMASAQQTLDNNPTDLQKFGDHGSWHKILEESEIAQEARTYQKRLTALGIVASVRSCRFVSQIAQGNVGGAIATGGLCLIAIGGKPERDFWVCDNDLGSFNISDSQEYVLDYETSKKFVGNTCWVF